VENHQHHGTGCHVPMVTSNHYNHRANGKKTRADRTLLHFQGMYNIHTRYPDIFSINISGKKNRHPSVIPAEIYQVIPGQLYKIKVLENKTAKVVGFTKIRPWQDRFRKITQSVSQSLGILTTYT
jgi:hypothetical protein